MQNNINKKATEEVSFVGIWKVTIRDAKTNDIKRVYTQKNIIPTVGRTLVMNNLTNSSPDNTMKINYTALGTGATAVSNANTTLAAETYRKTTASSTNSSNIGYVSAFYTATECDGTYYEAGLFSNATASTDSGILFSRVLLNAPTGIAKSNTETLTIDYTVTLS